MVNFELYKIFVVVASEHNITKASTVLNLPQATVSKNIKLLEKRLKTRLFTKIKSNLLLTSAGNELYIKLKDPINEIINIDKQFNYEKTINVGSHNYLLEKIFNNCIAQFSLEYFKVNLKFSDFETDDMLNALSNKALDIVFSKKVSNLVYPNLKFIKLGYLNDFFIVNRNSDLAYKILTKNDLKNEIIYCPNYCSQTTKRLMNIIDIEESNLKCSNYDNILQLVSSSHSIGFVTQEYLDFDVFAKYNLIELNTNLNLKPIEFGIYLNDSKSKELNDLVRVIKSHFFFKDF